MATGDFVELSRCYVLCYVMSRSSVSAFFHQVQTSPGAMSFLGLFVVFADGGDSVLLKGRSYAVVGSSYGW